MNRRRMYEEIVLEKVAQLNVLENAYEQGYQDAMIKIAQEYEESGPVLGPTGHKLLKAGIGAIGLYGAHKGLRRVSGGYEGWQKGIRDTAGDKVGAAGKWLGDKLRSTSGTATPPAP